MLILRDGRNKDEEATTNWATPSALQRVVCFIQASG